MDIRVFEKKSRLVFEKSTCLTEGEGFGVADIFDDYFALLKSTIQELSLENVPSNIYNCDESGFSGTINNSKKVVVSKGTRHSYQAMVNFSGHVTMLNAISAAGGTLPPLLIFSQVLPRNCEDGLPGSWVLRSSESGYINSELFVEWFQLCFVPYVGAVVLFSSY
ncbi:uncharacterized protein LOC128556202 [Mercenaria mercenaria]|uniref:uncharacterized protein LOC128556202 n=1 Tax=Mercenaria mercenaria TaxID=6596 RepID=UPI00234F2BC8|nr:uncharacterized protein LOC128556202 [Mercenaria mercenaria]